RICVLFAQPVQPTLFYILSLHDALPISVEERGSVHPDVDPGAGYFIRPHLVLDPPDEAEVVRCEQFGPVLPVLAYDGEDEAITRDRKSTRLNSSHRTISYAVFCLRKNTI